MKLEEILALSGSFTWMWNDQFFIETNRGNFIWSDPDYGHGNNTIRKTEQSYKAFCSAHGVPYGRDKGFHLIRNYCGPEVKLVE